MQIGFIGAGRMATTFGRHLMLAGHTIILSNAKGPETMAGIVDDLGPGARAGTRQEAAEAGIVILATNWVSIPDALAGIDWSGRILVDGTNAHGDATPDTSQAGVKRSILAQQGRASSEFVAQLAPDARVVKAISTIPMAWIQDFSPTKPKTVFFMCGDDPEAKAAVADLINSTGFVALDLGSLMQGSALQQLGAPLSGVELHFIRRLR